MPGNLGNSAVATGLEKVSFHFYLIEIYMQVKKQQLEPDMEQWTVSKLGKEYAMTVILSPCLFTYIQSTS